MLFLVLGTANHRVRMDTHLVFSKKSWDIVGNDFMEEIEEIFASRSLLKQINHTIIVLVPKGNHSTSVGDYRPIDCCNVFYKVITKILASRLKPMLDSIVDQAQTVVVEGQSMIENIHLAQELLRQYNRKRMAPRCLLKIDLRKVYDSVNWDFLAKVLEELGFPNMFVDWIMECVTTPSYSIALNGVLQGFFKGKKALHQAFTDDLMLFVRGDVMLVDILMKCLSNFGAMSGLNINVGKSCIYTAGIHGQELEDILAFSHLTIGTMPCRYLGIPLAAKKLKVSLYDSFTNKISSYIGTCLTSSLSYAGRAKFVPAVLQGVECFCLSIFPIPATQKGSLWIKWINEVHLRGLDIWKYRVKKDDSPLLKKLLEIRDSIVESHSDEQAGINRLCSGTNSEIFSTKAAYDFFGPKEVKTGWPPLFGNVLSLLNIHSSFG
ncbi:uncharacterized protein LOC111385213 [Olea europaea var. sylvestris]|uniref:uncharacterized protein LOC111385213 n=1 Tax=Olea europaea var. sylvestris TaxID=158386 RepID=UPI000C1D6AD7|nr:uncharacterized protein LOC111385213 [Olea europaea var. sylvestris]